MELDLPFPQGISLKISDRRPQHNGFPTGSLQNGFILYDRGESLAEEAVGFGVPVLQSGLQTLFPGSVILHSRQYDGLWEIEASYSLNLVEKVSSRKEKSLESNLLYEVKNVLAAVIRRAPALRIPLTGVSSLLRRLFHLQTIYEDSGLAYSVNLIYLVAVEEGTITMRIDPGGFPPSISQVMVMSEQGARYFDRFVDGSGEALAGKEIGCWDEVTASEARFESPARQVAFGLRQIPGMRLFRGRELVGTRLAWAGFGAAFVPSQKDQSLVLFIRRLE